MMTKNTILGLYQFQAQRITSENTDGRPRLLIVKGQGYSISEQHLKWQYMIQATIWFQCQLILPSAPNVRILVISCFSTLKSISGFHYEGRVTGVDKQKSIDTTYRSNINPAHLFLEPIDVKHSMAPAVGAEKSAGVSLYYKAVHAPIQSLVKSVKRQFGTSTSTYLPKFPDLELYRALFRLEDRMTSSQGTKSQMYASIRNNIIGV